jgi:hypothetical protein
MMEQTPKVVFGVTGKDVIFRHALRKPKLSSFFVGRKAILWVSFEVGDIQMVLGQLIHLRQKLPRPLDSFFLAGS